jgi:hypothetical protein
MKQKWILFFVAFFMGYMVWPLTDRVKNGDSPISSADQEMRAKSARKQDAVAEYEALILSEGDKFQLQLDAANTLASLLALVEKWNESNLMAPFELVEKLAAKYPAESLRYYAAMPTNAARNKSIFQGILDAWSQLDWRACITFVSQDSAVSSHDFYFWWGSLAEKRMRDHPEDCVDQFRLLSEEKQLHLINSSFMTGQLGAVLAPAISDETLRNRVKEGLQVAEAEPALLPPPEMLEDFPIEGPSDQQERDHCKALAEQWNETLPDDAELADAMANIKSHSRRQNLLKQALAPRQEPPEDPQVWLKRISDSMNAVAEIMDSAPDVFTEATKPYREALKEWLPAQSPRLQRAWAAELASREKPSQALPWIEGLDTEALRRDMRDDVLARWSQKEPDEAAAYITEHGSEFEQSMHLPEAVHAWALRDFESAKTWLDAQPDSEAKKQAMQKIGVK